MIQYEIKFFVARLVEGLFSSSESIVSNIADKTGNIEFGNRVPN